MSGDLKFWYLHEHQLFKNLSYAEIDSLCILKRFKKSKKSEIFDLPFSEKERIYFLKHGTVKLLKINEEGEEEIIEILQKGDIFGELGLAQNIKPSEFFKVVSNEAIICTFFREKLEEIMYKRPDFAINYIKFIGFNFQKLQNSYKNIFFKDAKSRLILLINSIIEKEVINSQSFVLPNYLTQKDIAQLICTSRQTVVTLFNELQNDGLIQYNQKEIYVTDIHKLKKLIENVK